VQPPKQGPGSAAWAEQAAAVLSSRPPNPDQAGVVQVLPAEFHDHLEQLRRFPDAQRMFDAGWAVALVTDLRRLICAQDSVRVDEDGDPPLAISDLSSLAQVALPLQRPPAQLPATFDPALQVWKISSPSRNVRITDRFGGEAGDGVFKFGFVVEVLTSFLSVAEYRGRLILRDGYHRAYRLMQSGIFVAPAFVRAYADDEAVFTGQPLPEQIWMGERPPLLADFADDALAHDAWLSHADTELYVGAIPPGLSLDPRANR
jgi:hypothetical protein